MEAIAQAKSVRTSPRKVRLVADALRGLQAQKAQRMLSIMPQKASQVLGKTLKSAMANAMQKNAVKEESLYIKAIHVTEGAVMKRFHPSTRGRVHPYKKRTSHIRIIVEEKGGKSA